MRARAVVVLLILASLLAGCGPLLLRTKHPPPAHHQAMRDHIRDHAHTECGTCHRSMR